MNEVLYLLEVNISLLLLFALYRAMLERETFFAFNRYFLVGGIVVSFLIPFLAVPWLPALVDFDIARTTGVARAAAVDSMVGGSGITLGDLAAWIYCGGVCVFTMRLLGRLAMIVRYRARFTSEDHGGYTLVRTDRGGVFSFFRYLFWDGSPNLSREQRAMVLRHEMVHIRQRHSLDVLLAEIAAIVCWFNPIVHLYGRRLKELHEYLADAEAVTVGGAQEYERLLAAQALREAGLALSHSFAQPRIGRRLDRLRQPPSRRRSAMKYSLALPLLLLVIASFSGRGGNADAAAETRDRRSTPAGSSTVNRPGAENDPVVTMSAAPRATSATSGSSRPSSRKRSGPEAARAGRTVVVAAADPKALSAPMQRRIVVDTVAIPNIEETSLIAAIDSAAGNIAELDPEHAAQPSHPMLKFLYPTPEQRPF